MPETKNCIKFSTIFSLGLASMAFLLTTSTAPLQAKALAKVNGVEITDEDLKLAIDDLGPGIPRQLEGKARESYVLDFLQKAQADKLSESPDFAKKTCLSSR